MYIKKMKQQKGITLVALIITIIVLLILAGVTISLTLGERGIFTTAQKATENYKTAQEKELASLNSFEDEINSTINSLGINTSEKLLTKADITAANYGDSVTYSANGENNWKIFYKDDNYVYLILSGYLPYSKVPSEAGMSGKDGKPYSAYWPSGPTSMQDTTNYGLFRPQIEGVTATSYSLNSSNPNSVCVSALANTEKWVSFVNTSYADFAIGAPTLEMWVASWNAKGYTKLYCNKTNDYGYYLGTSSEPATDYEVVSSSPGYSDKLYFPITSGSDANGYTYWMASPSACDNEMLMRVEGSSGAVDSYYFHSDDTSSVRPVVRLKSTTNMTKTSATGSWTLE